MNSEGPASSDPDHSPDVVGALSLDDLRPLRRLMNIPARALSLLFILAAVVVGGWWLRQMTSALAIPGISVVSIAGGLAEGLADVLMVLLPVALLWRVPSALRSRSLLFVGLSILATLRLLGVVLGVWVTDFNGPTWVIDSESWLRYLQPVAGALIAYGLLQLRVNRPGRRVLLVVLVAILVALELAFPAIVAIQNATAPTSFIAAGVDWWAVLAAVTSGFTAWIVIDAWLGHEPPVLFWTLLSAAALWAIGARLVDLPQAIAIVMFESSLPDIVGTIASVAAAVSTGLMFVAYLRYAPQPADATDVVEDQPR